MLAGVALLPELVQDVLHKLELVLHEGEGVGEALWPLIANKVCRGVAEGEEVLEPGLVVCIGGLENGLGVCGLRQDATLDDLVHVGAGHGETRVKAALDL